MNGWDRLDGMVGRKWINTVVFDNSWPCGPVTRIEKEERLYAREEGDLLGPAYMMESKGAAPPLPVEFWNHELMDLDPEDEEQAVAFMEKWGIPYHPIRNHPDVTRAELDEAGVLDSERWREQVPMPGRVCRAPHGALRERPRNTAKRGGWCFVSKKELIASVRFLQDFVITSLYEHPHGGAAFHENHTDCFYSRYALECAACDPEKVPHVDEQRDLFSGALTGRRVFGWRLAASPELYFQDRGISLVSVGLLTSAICWQLMDSFADDGTDWKICANPECGRVFKRKRPLREGARPRESIYCQESCNNAVKVKRFRQKGRAPGEVAEEAKPAR